MRAAALAALASAGLLTAATVTTLGWLAWIALVPVAVVALGAERRAARLAVPLAYGLYLEALLVPALPFGIATGQWGHPPVPLMVGDSPVLAVALVLVPAAALLLWVVRFGSVPGGRRAAPWLAVLVPALAWAALDALRVRVDPAGLWGPLFATQAGESSARLAAPLGPVLLTALIVAVNYALALALVRRRAALAPLAGVGVALVALALAAPTGAGARTGETLTVAALQPGYDTAQDELPQMRHFVTGRYGPASLDLVADLAPMTAEAARRGARLVVWPEATVWAPHDPQVRRAVSALARRHRVTLAVPFFDPRPDQGGTVLVSPDGSFGRVQPKQRPMWFLGERGANRRPPRPVRTAVGAVGTMNGVDNQDPSIARRLVARGADVLVSVTHDWRELAPRQRDLARLHAAATATPVVRSDWRYGSAIVDGDGALLADAGADRTRTVLVARVHSAEGRRLLLAGGVPAWPALAAGALALGWPLLRRRR